MNAGSRLRGVTLVELIVVTVIIAILTAIMTTVFLRAKESAKDAGCLANLKSIGQAMHLYANDHDGFISPYLTIKIMSMRGDKIIHANPQKWRDSYAVYTKNLEVFYCPRDHIRGKLLAHTSHWDSTYTSYETLPARFGQEIYGPNNTYRLNLHLVDANMPALVQDILFPNFVEIRPHEFISLHGNNKLNNLLPDGSVKVLTIHDKKPR